MFVDIFVGIAFLKYKSYKKPLIVGTILSLCFPLILYGFLNKDCPCYVSIILALYRAIGL